MYNTFNHSELQYIEDSYTSKDVVLKKSQQELAQEFGVSTITIRRALAELGLVKLTKYKTDAEIVLLEKLAGMGINSVKDLQEFIDKSFSRSF